MRRGFGDEVWRLATEHDVAGLERAAELLVHDDELAYDGHRARAFSHALGGRRSEALVELNEGWADDWPPPAAYALDVGRVHLLAGDPAYALSAVELESRGSLRWAGARELVVACVRLRPPLWRRGLAIAIAAEPTLPTKVGAAVAVLGARLRGAHVPPPEGLPEATPGS